MAKSQLFNAGPVSQSNVTARYLPFGNSSNTLHTAGESGAYYQNVSETFTVSNLQVHVLANSRTSGIAEVRFRKNENDANLVCQIPFGITGLIHDNTGSDIVEPSDYINYRTTYGSGGTGQIDINSISCVVDHTGENTTLTRFCNQFSSNLGPGTTFFPLVDATVSGSYPETSLKTFLSEGTIKNLYIRISSNNRNGDSELTFRKNGNDETGLSITIPASTSGEFQNTNSVSISNGDYINYKLVRGGSSGSVGVSLIGIDYITEDKSFTNVLAGLLSVAPVDPNLDFYYQIGGESQQYPDNTDSNTRTKFRLDDYSARDLYIQGNNQTSDKIDFLLRKNGTDTALKITIPTSTSGEFSNITDKVPLNYGDDINYKLHCDGTGDPNVSITNTSIRMIYDPIAPVIGTKGKPFFRLVGGF